MNEKIRDLIVKSGIPNEDICELFSDTTKVQYIDNFVELLLNDILALFPIISVHDPKWSYDINAVSYIIHEELENYRKQLCMKN